MQHPNLTFSTDDELPVCRISIKPRAAEYAHDPKLHINTRLSKSSSGGVSSPSSKFTSTGKQRISSSGGYCSPKFMTRGSPPVTPTAAKAAAVGGANGAMQFALTNRTETHLLNGHIMPGAHQNTSPMPANLQRAASRSGTMQQHSILQLTDAGTTCSSNSCNGGGSRRSSLSGDCISLVSSSNGCSHNMFNSAPKNPGTPSHHDADDAIKQRRLSGANTFDTIPAHSALQYSLMTAKASGVAAWYHTCHSSADGANKSSDSTM